MSEKLKAPEFEEKNLDELIDRVESIVRQNPIKITVSDDEIYVRKFLYCFGGENLEDYLSYANRESQTNWNGAIELKRGNYVLRLENWSGHTDTYHPELSIPNRLLFELKHEEEILYRSEIEFLSGKSVRELEKSDKTYQRIVRLRKICEILSDYAQKGLKHEEEKRKKKKKVEDEISELTRKKLLKHFICIEME